MAKKQIAAENPTMAELIPVKTRKKLAKIKPDPVWRTKQGDHLISEMDEAFLQVAHSHAMKQIKYHGKKVDYHKKMMKFFTQKVEELQTELQNRGVFETTE
jgi:nucleoside diphosphate kinase